MCSTKSPTAVPSLLKRRKGLGPRQLWSLAATAPASEIHQAARRVWRASSIADQHTGRAIQCRTAKPELRTSMTASENIPGRSSCPSTSTAAWLSLMKFKLPRLDHSCQSSQPHTFGRSRRSSSMAIESSEATSQWDSHSLAAHSSVLNSRAGRRHNGRFVHSARFVCHRRDEGVAVAGVESSRTW